ncbi:IQ motif, EF-hand binding site, Potassium channel, voltage-dependent, EAG/ELK/ERG [Artemisia annua]|uniref:IQ motif, EF-hand binding site, Potassium channel, voltage-dependent, EAG/ELK/ERG n=1 Tax=Artemisia annua TaxID=35608 RepID=A0A2U1KQT0_ARTAN|nr:IQ motif, EF-hand binding site, Potassium channel, voltage-dependent, EAG/ELK/ERG [Artemisia annua]
MAYANTRSVRFQDDADLPKYQPVNGDNLFKVKYNIDGKQMPGTRKPEKRSENHPRSSLKSKVLSRVFSEDYERVKKKILDPRGLTIRKWNKVFLVACLVSLFVDPLFFYLPSTRKNVCIDIGSTLKVSLTIVRSIADIFYMIHIYVKFLTAYVAPSSRVFGRGELVIDTSKIAKRYIKGDLWIDSVAALPLPQLLIWVVIPSLSGSVMANTKNALRFIIILQYVPRLYLIFPLMSQIVKSTGVVTETAWAGAAYNLMLYMLASHFVGASWYLLAVEREESCWRSVCIAEDPACEDKFFDCDIINVPNRHSWFQSSNVTSKCNPTSGFYPFGIYGEALESQVTSALFFNKYFYCLWFGLKNLSSLGQNLSTTTYIGEIVFAIVVAVVGLVLFALLIGNMQTYLQSTTVRLEEWRIRRTDTEQWMHHRQLPPELRQAVRRYDQYKWVATRGVDEESLLKGLPLDLRRDIKRHLCYDLVRRVPLFDQMDERMLDAICERLKPALCTQGTCLVREGDPVNEMLFIIRGNLDSYTTNGGRTGFFNSCRIGPGDFCGEELLTWALDPSPSVILPSSTRTVKALSEVEAFALIAEDLKFVASQFRRLHSKQLRHKFRFYSHQWRTWAACFVQAAWRRFKRRKSARELQARESFASVDYEPSYSVINTPSPDPGYGAYVARMGASRRAGGSKSSGVGSLQKPAEPDFSVDEE